MFWCLPWYTPRSERIKLKSCRNLIQHYLGDFLEEKLTLEQLSVNFYNGTGSVCDISLNCQALNALGNQLKWPVEVVDGRMDDITVSIPWSNLFKEDSIFKVKGLSLTLQPKVRAEPVSSILKWVLSNWAMWASPKQFLMGYKKEDGPQRPSTQWDTTGQGAEMFAESIDSILKRLKVKFEDTKIRIEHVPKDIDRGIALDIHIKNIAYYDEAVSNPIPLGTDSKHSTCSCMLNTYTNKKIKFEGISLYTDEFPPRQSTVHESLSMDNSSEPQSFKKQSRGETTKPNTLPDVFHETNGAMPAVEPNTVKDIVVTENGTESRQNTFKTQLKRPSPVLFATLNGEQELTLTLKHANKMEGPKVEGETFGPFIVVLSPKQLDLVIEIINSLKHQETEDTSQIAAHSCPDVDTQTGQSDHDLLFIIN